MKARESFSVEGLAAMSEDELATRLAAMSDDELDALGAEIEAWVRADEAAQAEARDRAEMEDLVGGDLARKIRAMSDDELDALLAELNVLLVKATQ